MAFLLDFERAMGEAGFPANIDNFRLAGIWRFVKGRVAGF